VAKHKYIETPEKMEVWKPIDGYEGYEVSNFGNVRSYRKRGSKNAVYDKPKRVKPYTLKTHCKEYHRHNLVKDGKRKSEYVHRLVAKAFIANYGNKPQVHHIDNNGLNNRVENLKWVTNSENQLAREDWAIPIGLNGYKYVFKNKGTWRSANLRLGFDKCFKTRKVAAAYAMQYY